MTREKVMKINSGCSNGFELDFFNAVVHKDNELVKNIKISETEMISARLSYIDEYEHFKKIGVTPILRVSRLTKSNDSEYFYSAHTLFKIVQGETVSRKNMKKLQEYTRKYDDETILGLVEENKGKKQVKTGLESILDIA